MQTSHPVRARVKMRRRVLFVSAIVGALVLWPASANASGERCYEAFNYDPTCDLWQCAAAHFVGAMIICGQEAEEEAGYARDEMWEKYRNIRCSATPNDFSLCW